MLVQAVYLAVFGVGKGFLLQAIYDCGCLFPHSMEKPFWNLNTSFAFVFFDKSVLCFPQDFQIFTWSHFLSTKVHLPKN